MSDKPDWEIVPTGEMQKMYGLYAENRPIVKLDPEKVPPSLRHLIPLAEKWRITDGIIRGGFRKKLRKPIVMNFDAKPPPTKTNWKNGSVGPRPMIDRPLWNT